MEGRRRCSRTRCYLLVVKSINSASKVKLNTSHGHLRSRGPRGHALGWMAAILDSMPLFGFRDVIGAKEGPIQLTISVPNMNRSVCATDGRSHGLDRLQHIRIFFQKARTREFYTLNSY